MFNPFSSWPKERGMHYFVPLLVPIMIGMIVPMLRLQAGITESNTLRSSTLQTFQESVAADVRNKLVLLESAESPDDKLEAFRSLEETLVVLNVDVRTVVDHETFEILRSHDDIVAQVNAMLLTQADETFSRHLWFDLSKFFASCAISMIIAAVSVDVWAITTLFTSQSANAERGKAYALPLLGLFFHQLLVIVCVAVEGSSLVRFVSPMAVVMSIAIAWYIRESIWMHIEYPRRREQAGVATTAAVEPVG